MIKLTRLARLALPLSFFIFLIISGLALIGNPNGLQPRLLESVNGPWGPITLEFSSPVRAEAAQIAISLRPASAGVWTAISPTKLRFSPATPFQPGQHYQIEIQAGVLGVNGEKLQRASHLSFNIRPPALIYLSNAEGAREIWRIAPDGTDQQQLSQTSGKIYDFHASRDGAKIAFALLNEQSGIDLWQMGREGENPQQILNCGADRCTSPRWSPDGTRLAYTLEVSELTPGSGYGAPRPWVWDSAANQTSPVYADSQIIGYGPSWSPDGRRLAIYDALNDGVRVLEFASGAETFLPCSTGQFGSWSPDGARMFYTDRIETEFGPRTVVKLADFESGEESIFLAGEQQDAFYNLPAWAPDGKYIALGLRPTADTSASNIWIVTLALLGGPMLPGEPNMTDGFYSWDTSGTLLVFQRTPLKGQYQPTILLYDISIGKTSLLVENASWPQWLP